MGVKPTSHLLPGSSSFFRIFSPIRFFVCLILTLQIIQPYCDPRLGYFATCSSVPWHSSKVMILGILGQAVYLLLYFIWDCCFPLVVVLLLDWNFLQFLVLLLPTGDFWSIGLKNKRTTQRGRILSYTEGMAIAIPRGKILNTTHKTRFCTNSWPQPVDLSLRLTCPAVCVLSQARNLLLELQKWS